MSEKNTELIRDDMSDEIIKIAEKIVTTSGVEKLNVRKIMHKLQITNRVFYNRFHNIDEILQIIYHNKALKIRECLISKFNPDGDFFEQVKDIVGNTLVMSYENKMMFNHYVFQSDSINDDNYLWWKEQIKRLIDFGLEKGYFKEVNSEALSYSIWCFIRGYNADALGRSLPKDEAVKNFKYSFGILLDGMKKNTED